MIVLWGKRTTINFEIILIEQLSYNGLNSNYVPTKPYQTRAKDLLCACICHIYNRGEIHGKLNRQNSSKKSVNRQLYSSFLSMRLTWLTQVEVMWNPYKIQSYNLKERSHLQDRLYNEKLKKTIFNKTGIKNLIRFSWLRCNCALLWLCHRNSGFFLKLKNLFTI
jgi:hypothetical protein